MPFVALERPSVALGTLSASLTQAGISCKSIYGNLQFAEKIGLSAYVSFDNSDITLQLGEWVFSEAAFRLPGTSAEELLRRVYGVENPRIDQLHGLTEGRRLARAHVDEMARQILDEHPNIVGCSSVFQQQCASLAVLRRVKELAPDVITMMGGANCEGSMGAAVHRLYPWVDFVVSGESDLLLPKLCADIFEYGPYVPQARLPNAVYGPIHRDPTAPRQNPGQRAPRAVIQSMDDLPMPAYDDYFDQLAGLSIRDYILPALSIETSRGCWWGEKHHCTFCGLNGQGMTYRAKSADHALAELEALSAKHGLRKFMTVDNILDNKYFARMLPVLEMTGAKTFFYAIKSNLRRARVEALAKSGIRWVQPGIEALHDETLKLLNKGASAAINIQLLKWTRLYGVWVIWNYLVNAPGDDPEWYQEVAEWLPQVSHMQPPSGAGVTPIRFDRFSPYFNEAEAYGLDLKPYPGYEIAYPASGDDLADHAYFFYDASTHRPYPDGLHDAITAWHEGFLTNKGLKFPRMRDDAPILLMLMDDTGADVTDTRPVAEERNYRLSRFEAVICNACDSACKTYGILAALKAQGLPCDEAAVLPVLDTLIARKLILKLGDTYLCLAFDQVPEPYLPFQDFAGGLTLLSKPDPKPTEDVHLNPSLKSLFSS